jgi:zinc transporter, ZIP family
LLVAVTLDGVPENLAMGVALIESSSPPPAATVAGYGPLKGLSDDALAWPLRFAAEAVLASLADTLIPEAFEAGGPWVAYFTALGFLLSFVISAA